MKRRYSHPGTHRPKNEIKDNESHLESRIFHKLFINNQPATEFDTSRHLIFVLVDPSTLDEQISQESPMTSLLILDFFGFSLLSSHVSFHVTEISVRLFSRIGLR